MKVLLMLCLSAYAAAQSPSGYPARGRPDGPRFDLPEKTQTPQNRYLPPLDPRNPSGTPPSFGDTDLSVQGLPDQSLLGQGQSEFQRSPVSGVQTSGAGLQADLRNLNEQSRVRQFQAQQENFRQIETQRQYYNSQSTTTTPPTNTNRFEPTTTQRNSEVADLNQGETLDSAKETPVVSQPQKVQDYPPEFFLNPLAQLRLATYPGQQFGRLATGLDISSQSPAPAFDGLAHLTALPSVLAQQAAYDQQKLRERQLFGQQNAFVVLSGDQGLAQQYQLQPLQLQVQTNQNAGEEQPQPNIPQQPSFVQQTDFQQPQSQQPASTPDTQFVTRQPDFTGQIYAQQPQIFAQQPQIFAQQPQIYAQQPQIYAQAPVSQMVITDYQYTYQPLNGQLPGLQQQLQSSLDGDKANDLDEDKDGATAIAVATAFGQRNKPRVPTQYGAPLPNTGPSQATTTDNSETEELTTTTESSYTVAQATAVADGRRMNARLRSRRPRPLFTIDKSGHLVLAREQ